MEVDDACKRAGVDPDPPHPGTKLGVSLTALAGEWPLHGLRHNPESDSNGWYIWSGDFSAAPDFFVPLHIEHAAERMPAAVRYLALPPGFQVLGGAGA